MNKKVILGILISAILVYLSVRGINLQDILTDLAEFYEGEVDQIMQNLPSIIEPVLILLLGVGVGAIAIAVIMPMYSLTNTI